MRFQHCDAQVGELRIGRSQRRHARTDHAAADDDDVEIGTHQSKLAPRASLGIRPAAPSDSCDSASFAAGMRSNASMPTSRSSFDRAERLREQPHQAIGEADDVAAIGRAPLAIAFEPQAVAGIERIALLRTSVREHFREAGRVAQTEIEALTGDRMQRLRGVADDRPVARRRARPRASAPADTTVAPRRA